MSREIEFKEASFVEGKLIRISRKKIDIELEGEETGETSLATLKLADGVNIDLDTVGEYVKAVIVDGKVGRISLLNTSRQVSGE